LVAGRFDWGEAPDILGFQGRRQEFSTLRDWLLVDRCRVIALVGMGGVGKTALAARVSRELAPEFDVVLWRSLRNAPTLNDWLHHAIRLLSDQRQVPPDNEAESLLALLDLLRHRRCLLVLDNFETLLEPGERLTSYRDGCAGFGRLLQLAAESGHQSCLVVTSREMPPELGVLESSGARGLEIHGLSLAEIQAMLADKRLEGDPSAWISLVDRYSGNALALRIVGETIRQVCAGDVALYLRDVIATYGVFGGIRALLEVQVERVSAVERDVLTRLAIEREPVTIGDLARDMAHTADRSAVIEAIETLRRRSLLDRGERRGTFTLQSMVLEYVTDRLVQTAVDEIAKGRPVVLVEQPLIKAQAVDFVRQTQERLIGAPILQRLNDQFAGSGTESRLMALLEGWRGQSTALRDGSGSAQRKVAVGYGPGNVVNLLRLLRGDLREVDLSRLTISHAYLALVDFQAGSLAGAHLAECVLAEAFTVLRSVALSGDGALLVAGTAVGDVWLWRVADRTAQLRLRAHDGLVLSVALTEDGRVMASGGGDGAVRLWDTRTGQPVGALLGHSRGVMGVALSANGRLVASSSEDGSVRLWESGGRPVATLHAHAGAVWCVAMSADGQIVASGGGDGTVRLWETGAGRLLETFRGHTGSVLDVALSADGHLLASSGDDGTVRFWDMTNRRPLMTLQGHAGVVWCVALTLDGAVVASGGEDGTVRLWETRSGRPLLSMQAHTNEVMRLGLSRDGQLGASCGLDTAMRLWDARTGRQLAALHGDPTQTSDIAVSADGQVLATKGSRGPRLWETATGRPLTTPDGRIDGVWRVALSADGRLLAGGRGDGAVCLWEVRTGRQLATLLGHSAAIWSVALSADGRIVASGGGDATVRVWDTTTGFEVASLQGHAGAVWRVALSADGRFVASGGGDGTIRLWETTTRRSLATLRGHTGSVFGVALSADGRLLASSGDDGTVRLWDATNRRQLRTLEGDAGVTWCVALSADGDLMASASWDGMLRIWESVPARPAGVATKQAQLSGAGYHREWRPVTTIRAHTGPVQAMGLSADGRLLVSGGPDGMVHMWEPRSGARVRTLQAQGRYQGLDITGLTGVTEAQHAALLALGAIEHSPSPVK
jgi:WD40 repeat protein